MIFEFLIFYQLIIQVKYLNNNIIKFSLIDGINIITHAIFMKIIIVNILRADWLYGVRIETYRVYVLGNYMNYI